MNTKMNKNKFYYPRSYKLSSPDQDILRKDFHEFVNEYREGYKNIPIVNILHTNGRGLGFIIDKFKNQLIVATCSHVVDGSIDRDVLLIHQNLYASGKNITDILLEPKKIYSFGHKNIDLSYIVCDNSFGYYHKQVKFANDIKKCLIGGYYFDMGDDIKNICDDSRWIFHTGYNLGEFIKVLSINGNEFSTMLVGIGDIVDAVKNNRSLLINNDMVSKSGMSGGPVISDDGICSMLVGGLKTTVGTLPIQDVLKNYNNYIKPTL